MLDILFRHEGDLNHDFLLALAGGKVRENDPTYFGRSDTGGGDRPEINKLLIHPDQIQFPQPLMGPGELTTYGPQGQTTTQTTIRRYDWENQVALAIAQELTAHPPQGEVVEGVVPAEVLGSIRQRLAEDTDARAPPASVWEDPSFVSAIRAAYVSAVNSQAAPAAKKSPQSRILQRLAALRDGYRAWADRLTKAAQGAIDAWAQGEIDRRCPTGASLPRPAAGGTVGLISTDDDIGKEKNEDHEERIGDSRIRQKVLNLDSAYHGDLLLSETQRPINSPTIPKEKFFVKNTTDSGNGSVVKPGATRTTPNQPEERLNEIAASPSRSVLREHSFIDSKDSTFVSAGQWPSLIRPAYADSGQGSGCAAKPVIEAIADAAKTLAEPPVVTVANALSPEGIGVGADEDIQHLAAGTSVQSDGTIVFTNTFTLPVNVHRKEEVIAVAAGQSLELQKFDVVDLGEGRQYIVFVKDGQVSFRPPAGGGGGQRITIPGWSSYFTFYPGTKQLIFSLGEGETEEFYHIGAEGIKVQVGQSLDLSRQSERVRGWVGIDKDGNYRFVEYTAGVRQIQAEIQSKLDVSKRLALFAIELHVNSDEKYINYSSLSKKYLQEAEDLIRDQSEVQHQSMQLDFDDTKTLVSLFEPDSLEKLNKVERYYRVMKYYKERDVGITGITLVNKVPQRADTSEPFMELGKGEGNQRRTFAFGKDKVIKIEKTSVDIETLDFLWQRPDRFQSTKTDIFVIAAGKQLKKHLAEFYSFGVLRDAASGEYYGYSIEELLPDPVSRDDYDDLRSLRDQFTQDETTDGIFFTDVVSGSGDLNQVRKSPRGSIKIFDYGTVTNDSWKNHPEAVIALRAIFLRIAIELKGQSTMRSETGGGG